MEEPSEPNWRRILMGTKGWRSRADYEEWEYRESLRAKMPQGTAVLVRSTWLSRDYAWLVGLRGRIGVIHHEADPTMYADDFVKSRPPVVFYVTGLNKHKPREGCYLDARLLTPVSREKLLQQQERDKHERSGGTTTSRSS